MKILAFTAVKYCRISHRRVCVMYFPELMFNETTHTDYIRSICGMKSLDNSTLTQAGRLFLNDMSGNIGRVMRKPDSCICENKDADQLRGNREADQPLCFRYTDSTIPLLSESEISSL